MAVPDPYKAAKPRTNTSNTVPRSPGSVPAPTTTKQPTSNPGIPAGSGPVPKPTTKPTNTQVNKPFAGTVPAPNYAPKSAISTPQMTDWVAKQNEQYANLEKLINTPFTYDPNTDPGYLAQRELAQLRAGDATRNALESANEKGILGSSMNVSQLGQIQQRAEQEAAAYIPEYRNQAYGRYQDQLRNVGELLGQARNLRGDQFNESVTEGQLTGNYMSPEARTLLNNLLNLKSDTEANWSTMSEIQRDRARAQGNALRSQLQGLGVDSSLFGADVTANNARGNSGQAGLRTLAAQAQDYNQMDRDRNFTYGVGRDERSDFVTDREFEYSQSRDKVADEQWANEFNRLLANDDFDRALQLAQQKVDENRERRLSSGGGSGGGSSSGGSSNAYDGGVISDVTLPRTAATMETWIINNVPGGNKVAGPPSPNQLEWIETQLLNNPNLSEKDLIKLYNRFGIPLPE